MDLHDATLEDVVLEWEAKTATLRFVTAAGRASLVARGLRSFVMALEEPWGPSVSVNSVSGPVAASEGVSRWVIEMQSGDLVELRATSLVVETS